MAVEHLIPTVLLSNIISLILSHPLLLLSVIAFTLPLSKLRFTQPVRSKMDNDDVNNNNNNNEFRQFEELEIYKTVFHGPPPVLTEGEDEDVHVAVKSSNLESLFEELDRFEGKKLEVVTSSVSGEDIESDEDSWRLDSSSSSFGSCGSTAASSPAGDVAGVLQKLELLTSSYSGEDKQNVKLEMKDFKTTSHVREVLKKFEPLTSSNSGEDQKYVKSISAAATEHKLQPVTSSISGNDVKTVKSTAAIEKSSLVTSSFSDEGIKTVKSDSALTSSIPGEGIKTVKSHSTVREVYPNSSPVMTSSVPGEGIKTVKSDSTMTSSSSGEDQKPVKSHSTVGEVYRNSSPIVTSSFSGNNKSSVQNSHSMQVNSWRLDSSTSFSSYGSMRKEKEWKRTLACKLFEERNNSEGGEEGMDSLWEAYEDDNKRKSKNRKEAMVNNNNVNNNVSNKKKNKKSEFKYFDDGENEDEDDDEDEFMSNGQLCCLKALKLSTGKMNLGMGKPNLVKIGKAIKGFGWLHHVGSKHGKRH